MKRREFIAGLGSAAAWPVVAPAQERSMPVVAFIGPSSPEASVRSLAAFHAGLGELGYVEGRNVVISYHWLNGNYGRVPSIMADLVRRRVAVIASPGGGLQIARAAKAAWRASRDRTAMRLG
jgi:putative ABC transport system substrate-binding protein